MNSHPPETLATSLNFAFLLPPDARQKAIELSALLNDRAGSHFTLNDHDRFPHNTLMSGHFPDENIGTLTDELRAVAAQTEPFEANLTGFTNVYGYIFWECFRSPELHDLHNRTIGRVNHLRDGLVLPVLETIPNLSPQHKREKQQYGALNVLENYYPHVTLGVVDAENIERALEALREAGGTAKFEVRELALGKLGDFGTFTGVRETFELRK